MVKLNLEMKKKDLIWVGLIVVIFIAGVGMAAWSNSNGVGHSYDEIQTCAEGQILKMIGGVWTCANDGAGTWINSGALVYDNTPAATGGFYFLDLSSVVGNRSALVYLRIEGVGSNLVFVSDNYGTTIDPGRFLNYNGGNGANSVALKGGTGPYGSVGYVIVPTNQRGDLDFMVVADRAAMRIYVEAYVPLN